MSAERIGVSKDVVQTITEFQKRCVGREPARVEARVVGDLMVVSSIVPPAPFEEKLLAGGVKSIRCARAKHLRKLESRRSIIAYLIEVGTGRRVTGGDIFVHTNFTYESGYWTDTFVFVLDPGTEVGRRKPADNRGREVRSAW